MYHFSKLHFQTAKLFNVFDVNTYAMNPLAVQVHMFDHLIILVFSSAAINCNH